MTLERLTARVRRFGEAGAVRAVARVTDALAELAEAETAVRVERRGDEVRLLGWRPRLVAVVELVRRTR